MSLRSTIAKPVNDVLRPLRVQLVPGTSADPAVKEFLPARKMIRAADKAGLSLGAYMDQIYAEPNATPDAVRAMLKLAELTDCDTVCEIGPGSGRYAEEVIAAVHPKHYEIYETAQDWLAWLGKLPNVVIRNADGRTLSGTPERSVDLVHSHKLFTYTDFFATAGYLEEMARIVRPGGAVAFDVVTEECLDEETVRAWIRATSFYRPVPRQWVVEFMMRRGLSLRGSHLTPLPPGKAELLVFRRD